MTCLYRNCFTTLGIHFKESSSKGSNEKISTVIINNASNRKTYSCPITKVLIRNSLKQIRISVIEIKSLFCSHPKSMLAIEIGRKNHTASQGGSIVKSVTI